MSEFFETICGISTPIGRGALSIIRVSGKEAISIVEKIFTPREKLKKASGNSIIHGWLQSPLKKKNLDEVFLFVFKSPSSYTGEDMVEISTHGGTFIPKKVLQLLVDNGARIAEKGEFTRRRFLNGKMSLLEAEALLDVIEAKTEKSLLIAEENLRGKLHKQIEKVKKDFLEIKTLIEADLDFGESDILSFDTREVIRKIKNLKVKLKNIANSYKRGKILVDGFRLAIIGKPNVGKSSLFNTILKEDRAIVTEIPGTTRDLLEGTVDIEGYPVILHDMAGIRPSRSKVEKIGIDRALNMARNSDGILFIIDASEKIDRADEEIFKIINKKPFILVANKSDLKKKIKSIPFPGQAVWVSAKKHSGINELNKAIVKMIEETTPDYTEEGITCTTERQKEKITRAIDSLAGGLEIIKEGKDLELLAFEIDEAINSLKELTGEITSEDILDKIFSRFCIGK
jgi:tRNA modification GTPase